MWCEDHWDHKFLVWEGDPLAAYLKEVDPTVVIVPFNPTAENLAQHLVEVVGVKQLDGTGVVLESVTVEETAKCHATFSR
jgi:6-pyruvoyltetrahydropterin/6-carboxytetrahydropterin synthase